MQHDEERFEQQRHRPHAEQPLKDHKSYERHRQGDRLGRILTIRDGKAGQNQADETERRSEVAMDHLLDGLVILERPIWKRRVGCVEVLRCLIGGQMTVAARPVGATESRCAQPHPGAQHDHNKGEHDARKCEAAEPEEVVGVGHAVDVRT